MNLADFNLAQLILLKKFEYNIRKIEGINIIFHGIRFIQSLN